MHVLSINGTEYKSIETWDEMPLSMAVDIHKVNIPSILKELYDEYAQKEPDEKKITELNDNIAHEDRVKHFPLFYGQIICILAGIPEDVLEHIMWDMRTEFYRKYCERFVTGIMYGDYSDIKNIDSFDWEDSSYYLPKSGHFMDGNVELAASKDQSTPMENEQTIVFTEIADLEVYSEQLEGGKYEVAANIISVMCRPQSEVYDEKTSLARAEKFQQLPMNIVWEVFFCILQLSTISSQNTLISKLRKAVATQIKLRRQALSRSGGTEGLLKSQKQASLTQV